MSWQVEKYLKYEKENTDNINRIKINDIKYDKCVIENNSLAYFFKIEEIKDQYNISYLNTKIIINNYSINGHCTCQEYLNNGLCVHIIYCLKFFATIIENIKIKVNFDIKDNDLTYSIIPNKKFTNFNTIKEIKNLIDNTDDYYFNQLKDLIEEMEITENCKGNLPICKAIYLNKIKNNYSIVHFSDNLINFLNSFDNYNNNRDLQLSILRDYQIDGINWLYKMNKFNFGCILADEMGLGKTVQIIYYLSNYLVKNKKALIIAPTSLIYNWKKEFDKFASHLKYTVIENCINLNLEGNDIFILSYNLLNKNISLFENILFDLIVIDEAQTIKNPDTKTAKSVFKLKAKQKVALTGTPIENSLLDLWSIFKFVMPEYLISERKFKVKYITNSNNNKLNILKGIVSPFILRREKSKVLSELPEKIENNILINMSEEQTEFYNLYLNNVRNEVRNIVKNGDFDKEKVNILGLISKLRQICVDPILIDNTINQNSEKINVLINLVEEYIKNGHKILIFTNYISAIELIRKKFDENNITYYTMDGSVNKQRRLELVDKFNSDDTNTFILSLKTGGYGLNLTAADVVIHVDLWWNPQIENQANDRTHRIGQRNSVEIVKLICKNTIEEKILEKQNNKKILAELINNLDNIDMRLTSQDIYDLLSIKS